MKQAIRITGLALACLALIAIFSGLICLYVYGPPELPAPTTASTPASSTTQRPGTTAGVTTQITTECTTVPETEATTIPETEPPTETTLPETEPPTETTLPQTEPPTETTPPPSTAPADPIKAPYTCVYDITNNTLLQQKGGMDQKIHPASITKLFNAYFSLQYLQPDMLITVGEEVTLIPRDASGAGLKVGNVISVDHLLKGMLIPSGCDASIILAVAAGRVIAQDPQLDYQAAYDLYMTQWNQHLQSIGMTGTHFTNPYGYHHSEHYTTMQDIVHITRLCLENPLIKETVCITKQTYTIASGESFTWTNTNYMIRPGSRYHISTAIGMKTGSSTATGYCLVTAYQQEDRVVVICAMKSATYNSRFDDTYHLYTKYCA